MYLNCKTWFSFRYGTFSTEELVKDAAAAGATSIALTNINNTCDTWDFIDFCKQHRIRPIAGAEIRNDNELLYILLAKNNKGFLYINQFLSHYLQAKEPFPVEYAFGPDVWVIYPFGKKQPDVLTANELIGVQPSEVNKLFGMDVQHFPLKWVIRQPVTYRNKLYYNLHRLLRAIDKNILLSKQQPAEIAGPCEYFVPQSQLTDAFTRFPFIITNTLQVMESCNISID